MKRLPFRSSASSEAMAIDVRVTSAASAEAPFGAYDAPEEQRGLFAPEEVCDGIAVLSISGPLEHHAHWVWTSYEEIAEQVEAAFECDAVEAVVLKIDSPGGVAAGMGEMHRRLRALSDAHPTIPLIAYIDEQACSAAYHLASACDEIHLPPAGEVGSVGVIRCTVDESAAMAKQGVKVRYLVTGARKADLHPGQPVTDEVLEVAQQKVDYLGGLFFQAVAAARGMTPDAVEGLQAAVFQGQSAVDIGLADSIVDGWSNFLDLLTGTLRASRASVGSQGATAVAAPGKTKMAKAKLLSLTKAQSDARAAYAAAFKALAKAPSDKKLLANVETTLRAKIVADDALGAARAGTTTVKHIKHEEKVTEHEEEEEEEEEEGSGDEEEEEDSTDGSTDGSSTGSSSDGGDDEEEEEKAIASSFASGPGLYTPARFVRLARQVIEKATGEKVRGYRALFGALDAMGMQFAEVKKLKKSVTKLQGESRAAKVDAMLEKAIADGKVTRAQVPSLRAKGMQDRAFLGGFLKTLPKAFRTSDDALTPLMDADGNPVGGPDAAQQAAEARLVATAKSPEEGAKLVADFRKRLNSNGAAGAPKH